MSEKKQQNKKRAKRTSAANKRAEEQTVEVIDHRLAKALGHPLRCAILTVANSRTISPSQYSREFDAPLSNVSYHFRELVKLEYIELVEEVPVRGSWEHRYRGCRRGLVTDANWKLFGPSIQAGVRSCHPALDQRSKRLRSRERPTSSRRRRRVHSHNVRCCWLRIPETTKTKKEQAQEPET